MKGSTIDPEIRNAFLSAFAQIPQRVIWKFEDQIEDLTDNVMLTKWMPQRDILGMIIGHFCTYKYGTYSIFSHLNKL